MNAAWWIGFLGAGVVLGSCTGYSSLGEVGNGGGESGEGDGMGGSLSTGAKGGQGRGGTRATGGAQGMGAVSGTGMGAVSGTGMGAVGGTGMGAVDGTGMGAVNGNGTQTIPCMTSEECPLGPPSCVLCADGNALCAGPACVDGICSVYRPPCADGPELTPCMADGSCLQPPCVEGSNCPLFVCIDGYCGPTLPSADPPCTDRACGDPCMAPDGTAGACDADGTCTASMVDCGSTLPTAICMSDGDCGAESDCLYCGEGVCADTRCLENRCELVCPTEYMCDDPMDCPKDATNDPCTTGPWECLRGFCAREYQRCSAPAPME